jgi:hypothetical protein
VGTNLQRRCAAEFIYILLRYYGRDPSPIIRVQGMRSQSGVDLRVSETRELFLMDMFPVKKTFRRVPDASC